MRRLLLLLLLLPAVAGVAQVWGDREGNAMELPDVAAAGGCVRFPAFGEPLGFDLLSQRFKSGAIVCPVKTSASSVSASALTYVLYSVSYCGSNDRGARAKWMSPWVHPDRRTQLIDIAEVSVTAAGDWLWRDERFPGPSGVPDIVVGDFGVWNQFNHTSAIYEARKRERAAKRLELPTNYTWLRWHDGMYFPPGVPPHGHSPGKTPFSICFCDESWFCGKTALACDVVLDMVREPWCASCLNDAAQRPPTKARRQANDPQIGEGESEGEKAALLQFVNHGFTGKKAHNKPRTAVVCAWFH
jgi:hypothetical protein